MGGVKKLSLTTRLSGAAFRFLIGLILEHNEQSFKESFSMTNSQAMACGGGNDARNLRLLRERLASQKIDGEWLLKFTPGNRWEKRASKYEINYPLILKNNDAWSKQQSESRESCGSAWGSNDPQDDPLPKIREEYIIEDLSLRSLGRGSPWGSNDPQDDPTLTEKEQLVCQCFSRACGQMWSPQTDLHRQVVTELAEIASEEQLETIADRAKYDGGVQPSRVIGWFRKGIKDWAKLYGNIVDSSGLSPAMRDELERELTREEGDFAVAMADDDETHFRGGKDAYLRQTFDSINNKRGLLGLALMDESVLEADGAIPF